MRLGHYGCAPSELLFRRARAVRVGAPHFAGFGDEVPYYLAKPDDAPASQGVPYYLAKPDDTSGDITGKQVIVGGGGAGGQGTSLEVTKQIVPVPSAPTPGLSADNALDVFARILGQTFNPPRVAVKPPQENPIPLLLVVGGTVIGGGLLLYLLLK